MQGKLILALVLILFANGCKTDYIVTTPDSVVTNAVKEDLGLSGDWHVVDERDIPERANEGLRIEGPDENGLYTVVSLPNAPKDKPLVLQAIVEPVPDHADYWLVEATNVETEDPTNPTHHIAYAAKRNDHLYVGMIDSTKLKQQLASRMLKPSIKTSWPFVAISANDGELRDVLCDDPKLLVSESTTYHKAQE